MSTFADRHRSDFNYNSNGSFGSFGDILWRDQAGNTVLWLMDNNQGNFPGSTAILPFVPPDWHVKAAAEFEGATLNADILWQNDNGALALWTINGITLSAITALPNPGPTWHVVGDNDFSGSGDDILFQNDNGALAIWTGINPATGTVSGMFAGTQNPGPTWHVVGTGDVKNGLTEQAGILWQNDNGSLVLWEDPVFFSGTVTFNLVSTLGPVDASWHVKGMQDINGDGRADVVFQNDNGAVVVWEMGGPHGGFPTAMNLVNLNPGPAWHIAGMRDMDGDAHVDILFQNDNGAGAIWENYHAVPGGASFSTVLAITPNPNPNGHVWDLL